MVSLAKVTQWRPLLWTILTMPGGWLLWGGFSETLTYGQVVTESGRWATWLLMLTMAITPLRLIFGKGGWLTWLLRQRRYFGVASFAYATGHMLVYLLRKQEIALIVQEGLEPWMWSGWLGLLLFLPLAATSTDSAVRALKRRWKRLHRLVYAAAVLVFVHWLLSAFDPLLACIHIAILGGLEAIRVALQLRQRVT